ncbi:MAG: hypothetical protein U1E17_04800 [Geminicoccaceae bacterium]
MDYIVATVHMQGFARMFRPAAFTPNPADQEQGQARGREIFEQGLQTFDAALAGKDYVVGRLSIADAALFYVEFWAAGRMGMTLPPNLAGHYARMSLRAWRCSGCSRPKASPEPAGRTAGSGAPLPAEAFSSPRAGASALLLQGLGHRERHLQRLLGVGARIAAGW